jgi:NTE family protein
MPRARGLWSCVAALALAACATPFDNAPLNQPLSPSSMPAFVAQPGSPQPPDPSGGANMIALSLSGGGMRAAAFAFGVL